MSRLFVSFDLDCEFGTRFQILDIHNAINEINAALSASGVAELDRFDLQRHECTFEFDACNVTEAVTTVMPIIESFHTFCPACAAREGRSGATISIAPNFDDSEVGDSEESMDSASANK